MIDDVLWDIDLPKTFTC